jgi:transposase InsO family protein
MKYADKYGVSKASRKYNKSRSYIYFWKERYDGSLESLACQSRRPHHHPNQHTDEEITLIKNLKRRNPKLGLNELWHRACTRGYRRRPESMFRLMRWLGLMSAKPQKKKYRPKPYEQMQYPGQRIQIDVKYVPKNCIADNSLRLYQYTAIDEYSRLRYLAAYEENSTYSSADFLIKVVAFFAKRSVKVECVQTDNGSEFTNRLKTKNSNSTTLFEQAAISLGIRTKFIKPYTPRHNGKVERSHREDQKLFYDFHKFYSLDDFDRQLAAHLRRTNNRPMRPLAWLSPIEFLNNHSVQYV